MTVAVAALLAGLDSEAALVAALSRETEARLVRRCLDMSELLTAVSSGAADVALLVPTARGLSAEALERLVSLAPVLAVVDPGDALGAEHGRRLGLPVIVAEPAEVVAACRRAALRPRPGGRHGYSVPAPSRAPAPGQGSTPAEPAGYPSAAGEQDSGTPGGSDRSLGADDAVRTAGLASRGRVVAVWGPTGAPGRTSTCVHLAGELARMCQERSRQQGPEHGYEPGVLLADADTYGPALAPALGVLEEIPGLAAACRAAVTSDLDAASLAEHAPEVVPALRILTGLPRTERWPELRPAALERVWEAARSLALVTLVDVGFCLEQDEELSFDTQAPRRNGATLATLEAADEVLAVCRADPLGVLRLVREWPRLQETVTGSIRVVVTGLRSQVAGADARRETVRLLEAHCGVDRRDVVLVPDDRDAYDAALLRARFLADVAPRSKARRALRGLAGQLLTAAVAPSAEAASATLVACEA